jgi:hypothetical protein
VWEEGKGDKDTEGRFQGEEESGMRRGNGTDKAEVIF